MMETIDVYFPSLPPHPKLPAGFDNMPRGRQIECMFRAFGVSAPEAAVWLRLYRCVAWVERLMRHLNEAGAADFEDVGTCHRRATRAVGYALIEMTLNDTWIAESEVMERNKAFDCALFEPVELRSEPETTVEPEPKRAWWRWW